MRTYLLAGAAALAVAAPASATIDNSGYVGLEGGILFPKSQSVSGEVVFTTPGTPGPVNFTRTNVATYKYKKGLDLDFVGGYDFGMFRIEGELGYKHAKPKTFTPSSAFVTAINTGAGTTFVTTGTGATNFGVNSAASVYSAMLNGLVDFGGNGSFGGYAGGGVGYANVHQFGASKGKLAWQLIAGAYMPVSSNIDIGLKYRYFHAGSNSASHTFAFTPPAGAVCGTTAAPFPCSAGTATFFNSSKFTSHSLLLSAVYSFGAVAAPPPPAPPPPPPPPPAPATQTCPDGSVIPATSTCPAPPPPPPPPPPPTQRGERGL